MASASDITQNTPPLVSFKTVKNVIENFKSKGVLPPAIDKRLFPTFSNTVANQTVAALKFLGLIDDAGVPTEVLEVVTLPSATEEDWRGALHGLIQKAYEPVMDVELDKVHGSHLRDKFKDVFGLEGDAQRKAIAFFLFAARDAGVKLSPYLKLRERGVSKGSRKKREKNSASEEPAAAGNQPRAEEAAPPPHKRKVHEHQLALIEMVNTYNDAPQDLKDALLKMVGFIASKGVTS